jgi:hypothetical protein
MLVRLLICAGLLGIGAPLASSVGLQAQGKVTLSGTAKTCFNTEIVPVRGVSVGFFRVSKARRLAAHLDSMARFPGFGPTGGDASATAKFDALETEMQNLWRHTPALGRKASAADGTFSLIVSPVDSVLVLGWANVEDEPYVYDFKTMPATTSTSFILDMSRGGCGF